MEKWLIPIIIGVWAVSLNAGTHTTSDVSTPVEDTVTVYLKIPAQMGLMVSDDNVIFDLSDTSVTFPPANFPAYYSPTKGTTENPDGVGVKVYCDTAVSWNLVTWASGDFSSTVTADQLETSEHGSGSWDRYTTDSILSVPLASGSATSGWEDHTQDLRFRVDSTDQAVNSSIYIIYKLFTQ